MKQYFHCRYPLIMDAHVRSHNDTREASPLGMYLEEKKTVQSTFIVRLDYCNGG